MSRTFYVSVRLSRFRTLSRLNELLAPIDDENSHVSHLLALLTLSPILLNVNSHAALTALQLLILDLSQLMLYWQFILEKLFSSRCGQGSWPAKPSTGFSNTSSSKSAHIVSILYFPGHSKQRPYIRRCPCLARGDNVALCRNAVHRQESCFSTSLEYV